MSEKSTIEWTEATWNPVLGCTHVSEGCEHCYAARETSGRLSKHPLYAGLAKDGKFTGEMRLVPERLEDPLHWRRPRMVFVNSMSDLFHRDVPDEFIERVFIVMARAERHTFQILTKRPGRMASLLGRPDVRNYIVNRATGENAGHLRARGWQGDLPMEAFPRWPLPNVWLGTSVETQKWADVRIPKLLETPAAVRFLSCEPLLGEISLRHHLRWFVERGRRYPNPPLAHKFTSSNPAVGGGLCAYCSLGERVHHSLDWVIVGGESGPGARPMDLSWLRSIVEQTTAAGVPVFVKQDSGPKPGKQGRIPDELWQRKEWPDAAR